MLFFILFCFVSCFYISWEAFLRLLIDSSNEFPFILFCTEFGNCLSSLMLPSNTLQNTQEEMEGLLYLPYLYSFCCSFFLLDIPTTIFFLFLCFFPSFLPLSLLSVFLSLSFFSLFLFQEFPLAILLE